MTVVHAADELAWPEVTREMKPWSYWWWMASAVDEANIVKELTRYRDAGMGGVHIIPIYGAKGWEAQYVDYLSPRWMELMSFTVSEARKLGLDVDMTTGTGWCFGGPEVTDEQANASVVCEIIDVPAGGRIEDKLDREHTQALMAFGANGASLDLTRKIGKSGVVDWSPKDGPWQVYVITQKPSGQKVKRAAPGGEGHMLNLFYEDAVRDYLRWFEQPWKSYRGPKPRAQYHDSYEYRSNWSPDLFTQFKRRRGYDLRDELPALFDVTDAERSARVKSDYRETASDLMIEVTLPMWVEWSHRRGFLTRNEAHGTPGNWLDAYAVADMPETEMFHRDRNKLISKFASSAAHVAGRERVTCETGTWLKEHFTETLADMKYLLDDLFLSGVNHVLYHGTCYSPDEADWPGWLFYASYEMNPRNSIWHDVQALNAYATRCQSVLQSGAPDNDILLYWPLHDFWHNADGLIDRMSVHAREWFEAQPIGETASNLWGRGYAFDYISDRQLAEAKAADGGVRVAGGRYDVVVVPPCEHMPLATLEDLLKLADKGATVIFEDQLPADVPGWGKLEWRRGKLRDLVGPLILSADAAEVAGVARVKLGDGTVLVGELEAALEQAGVRRERLFDHPGLMGIRRSFEGGHHYFLANRGEAAVEGWVSLAHPAQSVVIMDPLTGETGVASLRPDGVDGVKVSLKLAPGASIILRCLDERAVHGPDWRWAEPEGEPQELTGEWTIDFLSGGPSLPPTVRGASLGSWTKQGGAAVEAFAGTARYTLRFDAPAERTGAWRLDLGRVCQSARVRLNGEELGTLLAEPFQLEVGGLKPTGNVLEVDVTNTSANRIRDLDRRGVEWQRFHDINFVNIDYKKFNAAGWSIADSGLLGPVTLTPIR